MKLSRRWLKKLFIWIGLSLILQLAVYAALEYKLSQLLESPSVKEIVIPSTDIENIQLAPSQRYLSYFSSQSLEIYDLTQNKLIYQKIASDNGRVIGYSWLPDRDQLIYLYRGNLAVDSDSKESIHLYSLEFNPASSVPSEFYNGMISEVLEDASVDQIVFSTLTNVIYLVLSDDKKDVLVEIDVMKNIRTISRTEESIVKIAVSENDGLLYLESFLPSIPKKIFAVDRWNRKVIDADPQKHLLGYFEDKLYLGTFQDKILKEILTFTEKSNALAVIWQGSIPVADQMQFEIANPDKMVLLSDDNLYLFENGKVTELQLEDGEHYLSKGGQLLLNNIREKDYSRIKLIQIESLVGKKE